MTLIGGKIHTGKHFCRGCTCDDDHACAVDVLDKRGRVIGTQPCSWVLLDVDTPTGVCSACAIEVEWMQEALAFMGRADNGEPMVLREQASARR